MNVHALYVLTIWRRPVTGANSTIANSDIYDVGCNAVKMDGGNIPSLTFLRDGADVWFPA